MPVNPLQIPLGRLVYRGDALAGHELVRDAQQGWVLRERRAPLGRVAALRPWLRQRKAVWLALLIGLLLVLGLFALWRSFELQRQHAAALQSLAATRQQAREPIDPLLLRALEPYRRAPEPTTPPPLRSQPAPLPRETPSSGPVRRLQAIGPSSARPPPHASTESVLFELDPKTAAPP